MAENENAETKPFILLDLGANGGEHKLDSPEELVEWLKQEFSLWNWLHKASMESSSGGFRKTWEILQRMYDSFINEAKDEIGAKNVVPKVREWFHLRNFFHSSTAEAKFILSEKNKDPVQAGLIFWWLSNISQVSPNSREEVRAAMKAEVFRLGIMGRSEAELDAFKALNDKAMEGLKESEKIMDLVVKMKQAFNDEWEEFSQRTKREWKNESGGREGDFVRLTGDFEKRLEAMETQFKERMTLEAPVKHWADKKKEHDRLAKVWGIVTLVFGGLSAWLLLTTATGIIEDTTDINYWHFTPLLVFSIFVFWMVRLCVRLYLSNVHLATDAAERIVLINTYLALLENPKAASEEHRGLILKQIFRRAATGIVKDDAAPAFPIVEVARRFTE